MRRVTPSSARPRGAIGGLHIKARASRTCQTSAFCVTSAAVVATIFGPRSTRGTASAFTTRASVHIGVELMRLEAVLQVILFVGIFPQFADLFV